jgi:geranylgeranylglycerol-phosphate geranylgeranyltransferase
MKFHTILSLFKILRPLNGFIAALSVYLGAYLGSSPFLWDDINLFLTSLSLFLLVGFGNIHNDICDIEIDKINRPDRFLVRTDEKKIPLFYAQITMILCAFVAIILAFLVNLSIGVQSLLILVMLWIYNTQFKKKLLIGNFCVAFLCAWALIITHPFSVSLMQIFGFIFAFLSTLWREIVKDAEDISGDQEAKARTFPIVFGDKATRILTQFIGLLILFCSALPSLLNQASDFYSLFTLIIIYPLAISLIWQTHFNSSSWQKIQKKLKIFMLLGLIALLLAK